MSHRDASPSKRLRRWLLAGLVPVFAVLGCAAAAVRLGSWRTPPVEPRQAAETARRAAEQAAALLRGDSTPPRSIEVDGVEVAIERRGGSWRLLSMLPDGSSYAFDCARLPGAAPPAFAAPLTLGGDGAQHPWPELDAAAIAAAPTADTVPALRRDSGVALLHWDVGTELDDFVLDSARCEQGFARVGAVVVVPGHLWIEPRRQPWTIALQQDLTLVVRGNVYVGASVTVRGPGRLVLAAAPASGTFAFVDEDRNGCWSSGDAVLQGSPERGPLEGCGNVYLGLPRQSAPLLLQAGLVAWGGVMQATTCHCDGPVVLRRGDAHRAAAGAVLEPLGGRLFHVDREAVPGFVAQGEPRAGLVVPVPVPRELRGAEQPLYLAAPAR